MGWKTEVMETLVQAHVRSPKSYRKHQELLWQQITLQGVAVKPGMLVTSAGLYQIIEINQVEKKKSTFRFMVWGGVRYALLVCYFGPEMERQSRIGTCNKGRCSTDGSQEAKKEGCSQYPCIPKDLISSHQSPPHIGSTTSWYYHRLATNPFRHGTSGNIYSNGSLRYSTMDIPSTLGITVTIEFAKNESQFGVHREVQRDHRNIEESESVKTTPLKTRSISLNGSHLKRCGGFSWKNGPLWGPKRMVNHRFS